MATYIVGDVHGCYDPLRLLLDKISFDSQQDQLCFVGDLVNMMQSIRQNLLAGEH